MNNSVKQLISMLINIIVIIIFFHYKVALLKRNHHPKLTKLSPMVTERGEWEVGEMDSELGGEW